MIRSLAIHDACNQGLVAWPPSVSFTVGVEVKASYFDGVKWKATHVGEADRLAGQLRVLHDNGVNSVAFLHLASTKPAGVIGASWKPAGEQIDLALDSQGSLPCWLQMGEPDISRLSSAPCRKASKT